MEVGSNNSENALPSIFIAIINNRDEISVEFFDNFLKFLLANLKYKPIVQRTNHYDIAIMRNYAVSLAKEQGADYILFLDSDMVYPEETLDQLLSAKKDIIGGIYVKRHTPPKVLLQFKSLNEQKIYDPDNAIEITGNIEKMEASGLGGVLVKMSVFDKIEKPYFQTLLKDNGVDYIGEDITFFRKIKEAGIDAYCDTSLEYGHEGRKVFYP